jgi:hypothetical protein
MLSRFLASTTFVAVLATGAAAAPTGPAPINPCKLLSTAEVSRTIGRPVEPSRYVDNGVTRDGARSTTCLWQVALPSGAAEDPAKSLGGREFAILNVMNWPGGPGDAHKFLENFRTAFAEGAIGSQPVDIEIGADEALWWGDGVAARRGSVSIGMSVASAGDRTLRRPRAERLARLVVRRLARAPR